jgi:hypothetical protein
MKSDDAFGLMQFIKDYPEMSIVPSRDSSIILRGLFSFSANHNGGVEITASYQLEIEVPEKFPRILPKVVETGNKIPRDGKHHVNYDNTICLGSPLRLLLKLSEKPNLVGFSEKCLVPYLYAVSKKFQYGGDFVFHELAHGEPGIIADYCDLFGLKRREQVINVLKLLGFKRRIANKKPCPCECGWRLGKCTLHRKLNAYRNIVPRSWFRRHALNIDAGM